MRLNYFYTILLVVFSFQVLKADNDTLSIAKTFIQQKKFTKAERILKIFEKNHPDDLNTIWLYGQSAYWAGHYKTFRKIYERAMLRFPSNYYLKLDYALKLVENGDLQKAKPLLELYKKYDANSADLELAFARIAYWEGEYSLALKRVDSETLKKEKHQEAQELREEILTAQSTWIRVGVDYLNDDQPLQCIAPVIEGSKYVNNLCSPVVAFQPLFFKTETTTYTAPKLTIGNKFNFFKMGLQVSVNIRFIRLPDNSNQLCGSVELVKTYFKHFQIAASAARQPYLTTISSLTNTVVPYHYDFSLGWSNPKSWNGRLFGIYDQYNDNNYIYNIGAWVFAPPLKLADFQFRIGYAFGYGTSKENKYVPKETLKTIMSNPQKPVEGIYDPYFTPLNQQAHSGLINITFQPNKKVMLGVSGSIAFAGSIDAPYLFLVRNKNKPAVNKDYSHTKFYPNKIDAFIMYRIAKKVSLKANYTYLENNFYTSNVVGLSMILNLWDDRKVR
ncbi:MAG TPA: hypothetical protein VFF27_01985 [Bacteroidia bacterium]|nr:hypothetical protein [Bacteroidia bacterium]